MMMRRGLLFAVALLICATSLPAQTATLWQIGPFTRPESGNPVIAPRAESTFTDPVSKNAVHWEALHTFNPAAIVRDGKVFVLYRAEDSSGAMEIGGHTSRLGLAESTDGIHFTRRGAPVFFPANDQQKSREWPGGVEDPRIVESEGGQRIVTGCAWRPWIQITLRQERGPVQRKIVPDRGAAGFFSPDMQPALRNHSRPYIAPSGNFQTGIRTTRTGALTPGTPQS